jgi:crotonobetainyl-CoA:carnitine CoA-transferase CaiB-like acyl-CoA transferase
VSVGSSDDIEAPLQGIRIIDFTFALAGPLSTMLLADLGADVIKIEDVRRPESLVAMRRAYNRNKRSVALDLKSPAGYRAACRLIRGAQAVVSSFRPGVMESLGLGADALLAEQPDLVYASFSGFGETGPHSKRRGMDALAQAEAGLTSLGPVISHVTPVDMTAGISFSHGILAALLRRERTGLGGRVEGRLVDAGVLLASTVIAEYSATGAVAGETAERYPVAGLFETADGEVLLAAYYDWHWQALCRVLGVEHLTIDPRFVDREARTVNGATLRPILEQEVARWRRADLTAALDEAGVMVAASKNLDDVFSDRQIIHNQTLADCELPDGTALKVVRAPYTLDRRPSEVRRPPGMGEHTAQVLAEIGYSAQEIREITEPATTSA